MLWTGNKWDQRIDRARELAAACPFSAQVLLFYSKVTAFQKSSYLYLQSTCYWGDGQGSSLPPACAEASAGMPALDEVDLGVLMTHWSPFLSMLASEAPAPLAEFARGLNARGTSSWTAVLRSLWPANRRDAIETGSDVGPLLVGAHTTLPQPWATTRACPERSEGVGRDPDMSPRRDGVSGGQAARAHRQFSHFERFCAQTFLQPYAELLADQARVPTPASRRPICPYCGSPPLAGVLRQEGDGAKRSLVCSFCRTEWDYLRIACPACEESREERLRVYRTCEFDCVRVEACETCRSYIKTIDLTQNGLAVPEVDELATIPLTLWADEQGYKKVARNVIGL